MHLGVEGEVKLMRNAEDLVKEFYGIITSELKSEYNMLVELYLGMDEPYVLSMYYEDRRTLCCVFNQLQHTVVCLYKLDLLDSEQLDRLVLEARDVYFYYINKFRDFIVKRHPDFE